MPYYQNNIQPIVPASQVSYNTFVWVQGEVGALAYPVSPGNVVWLMDSTQPRLYVKRSDQYGKPLPLEIYKLIREDLVAEPVAQEESPSYLTKKDLEEALAKLDDKYVIRRERRTNNVKPTV